MFIHQQIDHMLFALDTSITVTSLQFVSGMLSPTGVDFRPVNIFCEVAQVFL